MESVLCFNENWGGRIIIQEERKLVNKDCQLQKWHSFGESWEEEMEQNTQISVQINNREHILAFEKKVSRETQ